ncbi:hypothetical protein [Herbidospora yilanensis]|uniref:hypothetical protein n=1 Tax=Herbidospora yilanensis TaxID=354426 RepID=UPI000A738C6E|nr:hypothetical protein [Herbidospora yilanensis]
MVFLGTGLAAHTADGPQDWTVWVAVLLVALSTTAGAWAARRNVRRISVVLGVASALMLMTALADLLPDAYEEAVESGVPLWWVAGAGLFGFLVIAYFTRNGCGHGHGHEVGLRHAPGFHRPRAGAALAGGVGTAVALSAHRVVEGATLALAASLVVVIALMVHSASEGVALAAMIDVAARPLAPWLALSCVSPAVGVLTAEVVALPEQAIPLLLGLIAGILLRTAIVGLKLARSTRAGRLTPGEWLGGGAVVAAAVGLVFGVPNLMAPGERPAPPVAAKPAPTPEPTPVVFAPATRGDLRAAFAEGRIGFRQILDRTDVVTVSTHIGWLLQALPGYEPDAIVAMLRRGRIGGGTHIGDLDDAQRRYLLARLDPIGRGT